MGGESVGEAGACEFPDNAIEVARVASDGGHLGRVGVDFSITRRHYEVAE